MARQPSPFVVIFYGSPNQVSWNIILNPKTGFEFWEQITHGDNCTPESQCNEAIFKRKTMDDFLEWIME